MRGGLQFAFPDAVGSTFDQGDVGMMSQAIQQSGDAGSVGENGVPVFESLVGSQQNRIALIAVVNHFEEQVGGVGVVSQIPTFVNDQQSGAGVEAELTATEAGGIAIEIGEQVGGGAKQNRVAGEHGSMGDVFGNSPKSEHFTGVMVGGAETASLSYTRSAQRLSLYS